MSNNITETITSGQKEFDDLFVYDCDGSGCEHFSCEGLLDKMSEKDKTLFWKIKENMDAKLRTFLHSQQVALLKAVVEIIDSEDVWGNEVKSDINL